MPKKVSCTPLLVVNMIPRKLGLLNIDPKRLVRFTLESLNGFPSGRPQHVMVMPDKHTIFLGTDASPTIGSSVTHHQNWKKDDEHDLEEQIQETENGDIKNQVGFTAKVFGIAA